MIKRFVTFLICIFVILSCSTVPILAASGEQAGDTLIVGVPVDRCPVIYQDANTAEIVGIGVDLMRAAAAEAGYSVNFRAIKEETLKAALDNPDYDLLMPFGSAISSAAGKPSIVSDNLIQTPFTLVTLGSKEPPPLNKIQVGMLASLGGAAETVRDLYPGIDIVLFDTMDECVKSLRAGSVDALLHNSYVWSYVLQKPSYSDLVVQPSAMFSMDFRAGTVDNPEGKEIIERLNSGIAKLTDTRRQAVILDYTTRKLYRYDFGDYLYQYGLVFILGALLFVSVIVIIVQKLHAMRMEQDEKIRQMRDIDPLTGVYSLSGFRKRVEELLRAHPDIPYLLAYTNIRNFKFVNDSLGMEAGDELLRYWVDRTVEALSEEEAIGRITGDRFAVLRRSVGEDLLNRDDHEVIDSVRNYFVDKGLESRLQICGGVYVLTPEDYRQIDVDHMLDCARVAEKRVRNTRKDGYEFYNPEEWEKGKRVADVISYLPTALKAGELQVWYQPQVNFETGEISGAEALCRWNHSKLGWLQPSEFIPTLEEAGLIYELDSYVWDRVCQDLQRWNNQGVHRSVSVNLSRCDIQDGRNIPGHFFELTRSYGLGVDQLRIEITETAYAEDSEILISTTKKLREFGFQVEMDDFGSGYSSLHMLKEVPVDRIKLDLHFLTKTGDSERGRIIVAHIIKMVDSLGMTLIAEGVENASQAQFLQSTGCTEMQGFYFYKPMSVQEFENLDGITTKEQQRE